MNYIIAWAVIGGVIGVLILYSEYNQYKTHNLFSVVMTILMGIVAGPIMFLLGSCELDKIIVFKKSEKEWSVKPEFLYFGSFTIERRNAAVVWCLHNGISSQDFKTSDVYPWRFKKEADAIAFYKEFQGEFKENYYDKNI